MDPNQPTNPVVNNTPPPAKPAWMSKKILIVLVLILMVLFVAVLLTNKDSTDNNIDKQAAELASQVTTVSITKKGFDAATVTIKAGQTVEWTNNDKAKHQIASDPHPSHDTLPELTDDIPLVTGDAFNFTFRDRGTFTYHDEMNPLKFKGTIIVE